MNKVLILLSFFFVTSCFRTDPNDQIDEGTIKGETYTSQEIGWTIEIPQGWSIISKDQMNQTVEDGLDAVEEVAGEIDMSQLKHLISFQKNPFNIFQSSSEPFELEYEGEWEENNTLIKSLLYDAFVNQGIRVDSSSSTMKIDGLAFEAFHTTMYALNGDVILYQDMYSRYINGFDFSMNLNYNNDEDKQTLMNLLAGSKFEIRN